MSNGKQLFFPGPIGKAAKEAAKRAERAEAQAERAEKARKRAERLADRAWEAAWATHGRAEDAEARDLVERSLAAAGVIEDPDIDGGILG